MVKVQLGLRTTWRCDLVVSTYWICPHPILKIGQSLSLQIGFNFMSPPTQLIANKYPNTSVGLIVVCSAQKRHLYCVFTS